MRKLFYFLARLVDYFTPEAYDDEIAVKKSDGIIRHMEVPDRALGIHCWHNLYYETSTRTPLQFDCMVKLGQLSKLKHWRSKARQYITTWEWICILNSNEPVDKFIELICKIEVKFPDLK